MRVRRSPFRSTSSISTSHTKGLPALWALRLLLRAQLWKPLAADRYSIDEDVLRLVNLEQFIDSKPTNSELCASLRAQLSALECKDLIHVYHSPASTHVSHIYCFRLSLTKWI